MIFKTGREKRKMVVEHPTMFIMPYLGHVQKVYTSNL